MIDPLVVLAIVIPFATFGLGYVIGALRTAKPIDRAARRRMREDRAERARAALLDKRVREIRDKNRRRS